MPKKPRDLQGQPLFFHFQLRNIGEKFVDSLKVSQANQGQPKFIISKQPKSPWSAEEAAGASGATGFLFSF